MEKALERLRALHAERDHYFALYPALFIKQGPIPFGNDITVAISHITDEDTRASVAALAPRLFSAVPDDRFNGSDRSRIIKALGAI